MSVIHVLFPQVRAELVRLLFADSEKEFHLRELARLSSLSIGTLQSEVRKLATAGLLTPRRDGNRLYYRANTSHPVFPELQGLALKTTGLREQLVDALAGVPDIEFAFVFGSQASGKSGAGSDVDLLVVGSAGLRTPRTPAQTGNGDARAGNQSPCPYPQDLNRQGARRGCFHRQCARSPETLDHRRS